MTSIFTSDLGDEITLTLPEVCRLLRICRRTFEAMLARGEAPPTVRIGRRRLVRRAAVAAWLAEREQPAA